MDYVAEAAGKVFERKDSVKNGLRILKEAPILRHFTVELGKVQRG
jgi:tryptophanase